MKKLKRFFLNKIHSYNLPEINKIKEWKISPREKLCILAPHADDETIGCGGVLAKYGPQCDVILLTDGTMDGDESIRKTREAEFTDVMKFFHVNSYKFMRAADTRLIEAYDKFKAFDFSAYDYVLMPHDRDPHKDHVVPQAFFKRLKKEQKIKAKAVYYEVWGTMAAPTHYINITDVAEQKREAIKLYKSQSNIDYADRILALNHYRGMRHFIDFEEDFTID